MPEAAVHEHGHPAHREHDIGSYRPTPGRSDRMVHTEAKAGAVKCRSQRALRATIPPAIRSHDLPAQLGHVGP